METAISSGILATLFAALLLTVAHYLSLRLWGILHRLVCYAAGVALIAAIYAAWCLAQPAPIPAWWGWLAFAAIVGGAGVGTILGWLADHQGDKREQRERELEGLKKQVRLLERRLDDGQD